MLEVVRKVNCYVKCQSKMIGCEEEKWAMPRHKQFKITSTEIETA